MHTRQSVINGRLELPRKGVRLDRDNKTTSKGLENSWERCPTITREIDYPNQIPGRGNGGFYYTTVIRDEYKRSVRCPWLSDIQQSTTWKRVNLSLSEETNSPIVFVSFLPSFFSFFFFFFVAVTCDAILKTSREYLVHSHGSPIHRTFKMITVVIKLPVGIWCDAQFMVNPLGKPRWVL